MILSFYFFYSVAEETSPNSIKTEINLNFKIIKVSLYTSKRFLKNIHIHEVSFLNDRNFLDCADHINSYTILEKVGIFKRGEV